MSKEESIVFGIVDTEKGARIALAFRGAQPVRWTPESAKLIAETLLRLADLCERLEVK